MEFLNTFHHLIPISNSRSEAVRHQEPKGISSAWRVENTDKIQILGNTFSSIEVHKQREKVCDAVLHSLYFPGMKDRYENVAVAHAKTFNWIFDPDPVGPTPWTSLVPWLREDNSPGLYWMTGKPGSGKSTLMKFLFDDPRTKTHLQHWAKSYDLVIASCFFWNPGSEIQKSLRGLLRSLLHDILSQRPDLIKSAAPWRWQSYELGSGHLPSWSNTELLNALRKIVAESGDSACFFILADGLDEFEGDDEARLEVTEIFKHIAEFKHVKVCVSSRPWPIFEDGFEGQPSLLLQKLTFNDITSYVKAELEENRKFRLLVKNEPRGCSDLVTTIVKKAEGVFLWVILVVRSLREGLRNEDHIADLQQRLALMPSDLEKYFSYIIGSLEPLYLKQAAQLFNIALSAGPLSLITYSFMQETDPEYALKAPIKLLSSEDIDSRHTSMTRRLKSRCKELLEVYTPCDSWLGRCLCKVDFFHRTVRDFLQTKFECAMLDLLIDPSYDVNLELCKSYLVQMKCINGHWEYRANRLRRFLHHAQKYEALSGKSLLRLLNEVDATLTPRELQAAYISDHDYLADSNMAIEDESLVLKPNFVGLTIDSGLFLYAREKLETDRRLINMNWRRPLIDYTLRPGLECKTGMGAHQMRSSVKNQAFFNLIRTVITQGGDPNEEINRKHGPLAGKRQTPWTLFVDDNRTKGANLLRDFIDERSHREVLQRVIELLIKAGACISDCYAYPPIVQEVLDRMKCTNSTETPEDQSNPRKRKSNETEQRESKRNIYPDYWRPDAVVNSHVSRNRYRRRDNRYESKSRRNDWLSHPYRN